MGGITRIKKPEKDLSKLPQWAQRYIKTLEMRLQEANDKLAIGPEDSDTFADPYSSVPKPLGKGAHVRWNLGGRPRAHLDIRPLRGGSQEPDEGFQVMSSHRVEILPASSNMFYVRVVTP